MERNNENRFLKDLHNDRARADQSYVMRRIKEMSDKGIRLIECSIHPAPQLAEWKEAMAVLVGLIDANLYK